MKGVLRSSISVDFYPTSFTRHPTKTLFNSSTFLTMENLTDILLWAGIIAGGILILIMLISTLTGLDMGGDIDVDMDVDSAERGSGLGLIKSALTFFSVGSFTARAIALNSSWSWWQVLVGGVIAGVVGILILTAILKLLLSQQEEGNYEFWDAIGKQGEVYVPIPSNGLGKINVEVNGIVRELPAKSINGEAISSKTKVYVAEAKEAYLLVDVVG